MYSIFLDCFKSPENKKFGETRGIEKKAVLVTYYSKKTSNCIFRQVVKNLIVSNPKL